MVKLCLHFSFRYSCVHFMFELFYLLRKKKGKLFFSPLPALHLRVIWKKLHAIVLSLTLRSDKVNVIINSMNLIFLTVFKVSSYTSYQYK